MEEGRGDVPSPIPPSTPDTGRSPVSVLIQNAEQSIPQGSISEALRNGMAAHPGLEAFVTERIHGALTPEEANLIGRTALVVYDVARALPVEKGILEAMQEDGPRKAPEKLVIELARERLEPKLKDKNSIYVALKDYMDDCPELAAYVARKMSQSVSLEEANLIGEAAIIVHDVLRTGPFPLEQAA